MWNIEICIKNQIFEMENKKNKSRKENERDIKWI